MRVEVIEEVDGAEDSTTEVRCPKCDKPWLVLSEENVDMPEGCPHLRFILPPDRSWPNEAIFRNGMTADKASQELEKNFRRIYPDRAGVADGDVFDEVRSAAEFWEQAEMFEVDTVVSYESLAGVNTWFTTLFAAKLDR